MANPQTRCVRATARLLLVLAIAPASFREQAATREPVRHETSDEVMGSIFMLVLYGPEQARLQAAADAAFEEAHRLDRLLSNYKPDSEWSRVNEQAAARPVRVSPELFDLLWACLEYNRRTDGAFDITVGPLMRVWGFYKDEGRLPDDDALARARDRVGSRHVRLDRTSRTVRFSSPGVELDPGGIGKGYAVDRMADLLRAHGVAAALVSAAGSSIYGLGVPPGEPKGWRVPIALPGSDRVAADVYLRDGAISTSGSYEKFFWADGQRHAHILDPRTGYPARRASSVSVVAPTTIDSEAWTKPFFINGPEWMPRHLPRGIRVFFCGDGDAQDAACRWIL